MTGTDWITCPDCLDDHEGVTLCAAHRRPVRPRCPRHPAYEADYCPGCGTATVIADRR